MTTYTYFYHQQITQAAFRAIRRRTGHTYARSEFARHIIREATGVEVARATHINGVWRFYERRES